MAPFEVAHGEVRVELNDRAATSGLHRLEADYRAAMARIDRMQAEATIDVNTKEFDAKMKKEEDRIKILRAEKADLKIGANTKELDRKILIVQRRIDRLKGEKAEIEIGTRGERQALATIETVRKAEAARAAAAERYNNQRERFLANEVRQADKRRQIAKQEELSSVKAEQRIATLRREYSRLDGELDKITTKFERQRRSFGGVSQEQKLRFGIDEDFLKTRMKVVKKELSFIGGHPPITLDARIDERTVRQHLQGIMQRLSRRGDTRISLGFLTTSVKTALAGATALSSVIVSLLGSATALVGVLGTSLAGAMTAAGGLAAGLAENLGGVALTIVPVVKNFKLATAATKAHNDAVAKYGAGSKEAITAQRQLNSVIKQLDPNSRQALRGLNQLKAGWTTLTGQTAQRNVGRVLKGGIDAFSRLMPILARNTNDASNILANTLTRWEKAIGSTQGQTIFGSLGRSANKFLADALPGLGHLGAAFGHVAESAARIFSGPAGRGFTKWAADIDKATQPGARLDGQIQRLKSHATDMLHLFGAVGRLLITVFNGGANAGDNMVQHMTRAIDKWNAFLNTDSGQRKMLKFFSDSEKNTRALFNSLTPIVQAFFAFSRAFQPITTGALKVLDILERVVGTAARWKPVRIFFESVGAVAAALIVWKRIQTIAGSIKGIFGALGRGRRGEGAQIVTAFEEGGRVAAEQIRAAMVTGGKVAGEEVAAGEEVGGAGAGLGRGGLGRAAGRGILGRGLGLLATPLGAGAAITVGTIVATQLIAHNMNAARDRRIDAAAAAGGAPGRVQELVSTGNIGQLRANRAQLALLRNDYIKFGKDVPSNVEQAFRRVNHALNSFSTGQFRQGMRQANNSIDDLRNRSHGTLAAMQTDFQHNFSLIAGAAGTKSQAAKNAVGRNIGAMIDAISNGMRDGRVASDKGLSAIERLARRHTGASAQVTQSNMEKFVSAIRTAMSHGQIAASTGNRLIHQAFVQAFKDLGLSASDIKGLGPNTTPQDLLNLPASSRGGSGAGHVPGNAAGGWIGNPGQRGMDTEVALLGRGEAVLNHHQQGPVNEALMSTYGMTLDDLFQTVQTPHYAYAGGGRARGVTPAVSRAMSVLSRKFGLSVTSTTGGTHAAGSYHYLGEAADLAGTPGIMYKASEWIKRSGMGRSLTEGIHNPNLSISHGSNVAPGFWGASTWANHANHIHIAIAGMLGAFGGAGVPHIRVPRVTGRGAVAGLVRGGLAKTTHGANHKLARLAAAFGGGGDSFDVAPQKGAFGFGALERLWVRAGGNPAVQAIMAHIALAESSGIPGNRNPSGASGLWQILGQLVPGNIFNPMVNARNAVAKYLGNGLRPWDASRGVWGRFLAKGGRVARYARGRPGQHTPRTRTARRAPHAQHHGHHTVHKIRGSKYLGKQVDQFNEYVAEADRAVNIDLPSQDEHYNRFQQLYDLRPEVFIVTPVATKENPNPVPYIDDAAVERRRGELNTLIFLRRATRQTENKAVTALKHIVALRGLRRKLKERLEFLQKQAKKLQDEITALHHTLIGLHGKGSAGKRRKLELDLDNKRGALSDVNDQIKDIKGVLGDFDTTISDAESNLVELRGVSGEGGREAETKFDITELKQQLSDISDDANKQALAEAVGVPSEPDTSADAQALIDQANERARQAGVNQAIAETTLSAFTGIGDLETGGRAALNLGPLAGGGSQGSLTNGLAAAGTVLGGGGGGGHIRTGGTQAGLVALSGGGGGGGTQVVGGVGGGGSVIVQQTFNSLLPSDPDTLRQVGSAAAGGLSYQGYTGGTTVVSGL